MELLLLLLAGAVIAVAYLLLLNRQRGYRVKNRDVRKPLRQGRHANRPGPDLQNMLD